MSKPNEELCRAIEKAVCEFSMGFSHSFTKEELEEIVLEVAHEVTMYLATIVAHKENVNLDS